MNTKPLLPVKLAGLLAGLALTVSAFAQGTAFTYQGRLDHNGTPANGSYDLRFTLHDSASGGTQQANPLTNSPTALSNGLFTVTLDFGNQFPGTARWLEIGVRTNGDKTAYQVLSPRQSLLATPYAVRSAHATTANSASSVAAANITGALNVLQLPSTVITNGASGVNLGGSFSGNAGGLSNVQSASLVGPLTVNATQPVPVGHVPNVGFHEDLALSGDYAYVASYGYGLQVFQIRNPATPVKVGQSVNFGARAVSVAGSRAYVAADEGLWILDISDPFNPVPIVSTNSGSHAYGVAVSGNYVYLANGSDGLRVYDVSNVNAPVQVAHSTTGGFGFAYDVAVSGNSLYLANGNRDLQVYDISTPSAPVDKGRVLVSQVIPTVQGMAVWGSYLYLASGIPGLVVCSITNPAVPVVLSETNNGGVAVDVAISGDYLYLANGGDGLRVYSLANPAAPAHTGNINLGGSALGVAASGDLVYLANGADGLRIFRRGRVSASSLASAGDISIAGNSALELGAGIPGKEANAGKILYQGFSDGLDILGAGNDAASRKIHFHAAGGAIFTGPVTATSFQGNGSGLTGLNASALTSGSVQDNRLSNDVARRSGGNTFSGQQTLAGGSALELGGGISKEDNAGKILYQGFSAGLDIVGAGTNVATRRVTVFAEAGAAFTGPITASGFSGSGSNLTNLSASAFAIGTLSDQRLSANVPLLNRVYQNFNGTNSFTRVGIGTTNPAVPLSFANVLGDKISLWNIAGSHYGLGVQGNLFQIYSDGPGSDIAFGYGSSANFTETMRINGDGNVGIGTTDPGLNKVQINTPFVPGDGYGLSVSHVSRGLNIQIQDINGKGLVVDNAIRASSGCSLILARDSVAATPRNLFEVRSDGRTLVRELEITGGADLAEPFNVSAGAEVKPGMVMAIDPEKPGELRVATEAYDRTVAGVISGAGGVKPGVTLRQEDSTADGSHPVALSGRVYCWVDADANGPVRPGDLLTTSGTPGHAMRATDHARSNGALIGKAMTRLESGRGLVLVLVSLQ